jgi:hypothetical protein
MKLRPRIALVSCLVALISVGVTGALLIRQSRAWSAQELLQRQTLMAQTRAFALGDDLETASRELIRLSQSAEVDLTDNDVRPEAALLAHAHRNSTIFNAGLQVVDKAGRCLWSEPASADCPGRSYAGEPWFQQGKRAKGAIVMPQRAADQATVINVVVPVGGRFDAPDGVLRGMIDLRNDKIISPPLPQSLPTQTGRGLRRHRGRALGLRARARRARRVGAGLSLALCRPRHRAAAAARAAARDPRLRRRGGRAARLRHLWISDAPAGRAVARGAGPERRAQAR